VETITGEEGGGSHQDDSGGEQAVDLSIAGEIGKRARKEADRKRRYQTVKKA
jgi:hypothetical protein